jgi:hypothetical protein
MTRQTSDIRHQTSRDSAQATLVQKKGMPRNDWAEMLAGIVCCRRFSRGSMVLSESDKVSSINRILVSAIGPCASLGTWVLGVFGVSLLLSSSLSSQTFPLELKQDEVNYNLSSERGLPISNDDNEFGSDGRGPAIDVILGDPGEHQWRTVVTFGSVLGRTTDASKYPSDTFNSTDASAIPSFVLQRAAIGAPYIARSSSFLIGDVISVPEVTEDGDSLPSGVSAEEYWFLEPNDSGTAYWSPHAGILYAVLPGNLNVVWVKRESEASTPADSGDTDKWLEVSNTYFRKYKKTYVVSGSAVKDIQKIYWNTSPFTGASVDVPSSRIGDVYFAYNSDVPENVDHDIDPDTGAAISDFADPLLSRADPSFIKTIWAERSTISFQIRAQNVEGRIFMEILGDPTGDKFVDDSGLEREIRTHLGFEIIDVLKFPVPENITVELGEIITPGNGASDLLAKAADQVSMSEFYHEHYVTGVDVPTIYAIRETINANDLLLYWLIEGVEGVRWPDLFVRYELVWPDDLSRFSHYVRPEVDSEEEALASAVQLDGEDSPTLEYQDPLDVPRAKLTDEGLFYTVLDSSYPKHRSLLRFNIDDKVAFERVYSWLDDQLLTGLGGVAVSENNSSLSDNAVLVANMETDSGSLSEGFSFDSQAFTVEAQVTLATRGDFDRLLQLTVRESDDSLAILDLGLSVSSDQPYPYVDLYGEILDDPETANLNGESALGGLRYRADMMPVKLGHTDLTDWQSISFGGAASGLGITAAAEHYGVLFRGNGRINVWDGIERNITGQEDIFYVADGDHGGAEFRVDVLATSGDGNPFDGSGGSIIEVYSAYSAFPLHSYEKDDPGYANNYFNEQTNGDGEIRNLRVTRISDGTAFAVASSELPLGTSIQLTLVGDGDQCRIYLNGLLVGEGPNIVGVSGTVESLILGSDTVDPTDVAVESLQIWSLDSSIAKPRIVYGTVEVGNRIISPSGESGSESDDDYLAGYINQEIGTSFSPNAYVDPMDVANGFALANEGAIIPVNAIPGDNLLEVWWMRSNGADTGNGFHTVYWPSVIGRYTIEWPSNSREIVLASNDGSGGLDIEAKGSIYTQNLRDEAGYNPNEEHALMSGGQAFALRDDLNITSGDNYSSEPFVLLEYTEVDGRLAMVPFEVLREKPEEGVTFKFDREAGIVLQAPMPLPLLPNPVPEDEDASLNTEVGSYTVEATTVVDMPNGQVTIDIATDHAIVPFNIYAVQDPELTDSRWVYVTAADYSTDVVDAYISTSVPIALSAWEMTAPNDPTATLRLAISDHGTLVAGQTKVHLVSEATQAVATVTVEALGAEESQLYLDLPIAETNQGDFELFPVLITPDVTVVDNQFNEWALRRSLVPAGVSDSEKRVFYTGFTRQDRKGNTWIYRGPHSDDDAPALDMQFYYPTQTGFWFPSLAIDGDDQPPLGTLTPYLRIEKSDGSFQGEGIYAVDPDTGEHADQGLPIAYRPVWPDEVPVMNMAQTLTTTINGLPAIRGNSSLEILYDQSQVSGQESVVLHDSTREKEYYLGDTNVVSGVDFYLLELPSSAATETYNGDVFFTGLPPHLESRFFFDPNRGTDGALVFRGEHRDETVGEDYVLLNIISDQDLATLKSVVPDEEEASIKSNWDFAIENLSSLVDLFIEDPSVPGTHVSVASVKAKLDSGGSETPDEDYYDELGGLTEIGDAAELAIFGLDEYHSGITRTAQDLVSIVDDDEAVDSYALTAMGPGSGYISLIAGDGEAFSDIADPVSILILKVDPNLHQGELKIILSDSPLAEKVTLQQVVDLASLTELYDVQWKTGAPVDGLAPAVDPFNDNPGSGWLDMDSSKFKEKIRSIVGDTADVQSLSDQHIIMRFQANVDTHVSWIGDGNGGNANWSEWTDPVLVEGWIKRVLAGINPFNQRTSDLFNNAVDTDASMLTLAGPRWEGNVALNSDTVEDFGLIEIYETVLNRGRGLSIDADINYGPANDALLLAAGYINDLYMFLGNEALSDALNPTIGISTADGVFGDIATSLFAFKGQTATLLEEELALMRGRDDFIPPGVEANPVYNRLFWNYTRGIDSGEVIYALNYNIQESDTETLDGVIDAEDAAALYPQGHGDAYGHYLTALKNYFSLLIDDDFEWVPRTEGVTILGQTVQVDYTDERKFSAAAAATAEAGKQAFELTWRQDYVSGDDVGWEHFGAEAIRENSSRETTRYWGADHWASRSGQGAFVNWVVGNAMLPEVDDDPSHEGIQIIDRTTVPELSEIVDVAKELQTSADNADAHLNPLGLSNSSMAFDVNPSTYSFWLGGDSSHFEQIYERAKAALNNAVTAFDDAKSVTTLMRRETDSQVANEAIVQNQEIAYTNALIELYGTPYSDGIGVGQTYATGYEGPDLTHYMYVDNNELSGPAVTPDSVVEFVVDIQDYSSIYKNLGPREKVTADFVESFLPTVDPDSLNTTHLSYTLDSHGFFSKPSDWAGKRESPGEIQFAIADVIKSRNSAHSALRGQQSKKYELDRMIEVYNAQLELDEEIDGHQAIIDAREASIDLAEYRRDLVDLNSENALNILEDLTELVAASVPETAIFGWSFGGDFSKAIHGPQKVFEIAGTSIISAIHLERAGVLGRRVMNRNEEIREIILDNIDPSEDQIVQLESVLAIDLKLQELQNQMHAINQSLQELADSRSRYDMLIARGNRLQSEREVFRKQTAATTQGFRTRDAAFRVFRDEKLERYNSLFDLAARYAFLTAQAYDYETGLLNTDEGRSFIDRIVGSRALGVVTDGEPQFAGSNTGDPGLSSTLAEMAADFEVLKGRLGLINPDVYGTTVSLRTENFRILPGSDGDTNWRDVLYESRKENVLEDEDVFRHCLQIDKGDGLPVPGLIIEFSTEISDGFNLFGQPLAGGDHAFDTSSFATKIFSVGVALEGYNGMDNPGSNSAVTGESSISDPTASFLDSATLSATPHVYLIPVGLDAMRSPALGDQSVIRTWSVDDVTIPLPFNIGASDFSSKKFYQAADSLPEDLFSIRKHQAFRPVSDVTVFGENGQLLPATYTNSRLIGRSIWNTKWKIVIPGRTLLNDAEQGLDVLIDTLSDLKIHFETYSYSGN